MNKFVLTEHNYGTAQHACTRCVGRVTEIQRIGETQRSIQKKKIHCCRNRGIDRQTRIYRKNIRGRIAHILDGSGIIRAEYIYDAWGSHKVLDENGNENTDINFIGNVNAFRYRSYYYDIETDLYYLRSRYYDPRTGRFINADSISILDDTQTDINGLNLYAYCANNPIMFFDPTGRGFWSILRKNIVSIVQIAVGAVLIATGVGAGLGAMMIIGGTLGLLDGAIGQIGGGAGSIFNGWGAISTGISLFSFGIPGMIAGAALIVIGAATMVFGANEIVAGITGTNYIQQITGMSDAIYGNLYLGLDVISSVATIAGRHAMKIKGTTSGHTSPESTPYGKNTSGNNVYHYDSKGNPYWSKHNIGTPKQHWHTSLGRDNNHIYSYTKLICKLIIKDLFRR